MWVHVSVFGACALYEFVCVCVLRSDMSQFCSCIPLAQTFSCPRRWYFSSDETNFIPFLIVLRLLQDVSRKLRQAKWGWWIQGGNIPQQCSVASKHPQTFCCCSAATSLASDLNGHGGATHSWLWYSLSPIWSLWDLPAVQGWLSGQQKLHESSWSRTKNFDYTEISIFMLGFNYIH